MRLLFFMHSVNYDRLFEQALRSLLDAGHDVHVALDRDKIREAADTAVFDALRETHSGFSYGPAPERRSATRLKISRRLRASLDYLRYLEPEYAAAAPLRDRARERAHRLVPALVALPGLRSARGRRVLKRALGTLDRAVPLDPNVSAFVRERRPDVVLVTPLVNFGSLQDDYVRAARALGIPTVLPVASWDNLTNKGLVREAPDLTIVWNELQKREATTLHGLPAERVVVTGAHSYDHWFDWKPSTSREDFYRRVGLAPERPFVLYAGSSFFIAPHEAATVRLWLERLRGSTDPRLRELGVLVRPHPSNGRAWRDADLSDLDATIWPPVGGTPTTDETKTVYFDSLFHSSAVVGLNTSALVEAAIVGRPVLTLLDDETRRTQEGTLHFAYLADGVLQVSHTWAEHERQLLDAIDHGADERSRAFVSSFVRPNGLEVPAAQWFVSAVERAAELRSATTRIPRRRLGPGSRRRAVRHS